MLIDIVQWMQAHQLVCPVKKYLNIDCPGCGLQRSFTALLEGDWVLSASHHPATIPLSAFFLYAALHVIFKFKNGNRRVVYSYLFVAAIIVSNYIYKIVYQNIT